MDIGANDPIFINNTYFLEQYRSWRGLAFEPLQSRCAKWDCRHTECLQVALSDDAGTAEFCEYAHEYDYMSGLAELVRFEGRIEAKYLVEVHKLSDILSARGIDHVDYVSLDVEGAELDVLRGIDFSRCDFTAFTIECEEKQATFLVRRFMIEHGYEFIGRLWHDDLWVKKGYCLPDYDKKQRDQRYKEYSLQ